MQTSRGIDASFLYMETPAAPMHTLKVGVFGPDADGRVMAFDQLRPRLTDSVARIALLHHRAVRVPFGLGRPVWVADSAFDLEEHVHQVDIGPDAALDRLFEVVSEFASHPLPLNRPLWQFMFVTGLAGPTTGSILKIHHAIADGGKTVQMFEEALDAESTTRDRELPVWRGESAPSMLRLLALVLGQIGTAAWRFPGLFGKTARGWWRARGVANGSAARAGVFQGPAGLSFNRGLTPRRVFRGVQVPFARLDAIKRTTGCSINDVFLAVCGGALRRYLQAREELPSEPLVASIPIALPGARGDALQGNAVSSVYAELATDEADPRARLDRIKASMDAAKARNKAVALDVAGWMEELPPALAVLPVRAVGQLVRSGAVRSPINVIISNVRGPEPLYRAGRRLERLWSTGPLVEGVGLNITAWSYDGAMSIGLLACPDITPDLSRLAAAFEPALDDLEQACRRAAGGHSPSPASMESK